MHGATRHPLTRSELLRTSTIGGTQHLIQECALSSDALALLPFAYTSFALVLFGDSQLHLFIMHLEADEFKGLDLDVKVGEPLVNISNILLLNVFELVARIVHLAIQDGQFELALVNLEVSIDQGEGSPTHDIVLA